MSAKLKHSDMNLFEFASSIKFIEGAYFVVFELLTGNDFDYAASAACQISGIVAVLLPSLPSLNCRFLIFSASSMPPITTTAVSKLFKPSIGRSRCLIRRWSCSIVQLQMTKTYVLTIFAGGHHIADLNLAV
jgi:hypothetical protein